MRVVQLELRNFRALQNAKLSFNPGINLIVGVNGVGKTSLLDALSICLSSILKKENALNRRKSSFGREDICFGKDSLHVHCQTEMKDGRLYSQIYDRRIGKITNLKEKGSWKLLPIISRTDHISASDSTCSDPLLVENPLAILFSTRRSQPSSRPPNSEIAAGGIRAACAGALSNRGLRLREFHDWIRAQEALAAERPSAEHMLAAVKKAITRFLPGYRNLRVDHEDENNLLIDHGDMAIPVRLLSDGERGLLAMVLDLTRRLAQANPEVGDPAAEAEAVVLIDEIELHLHPEWQRRAVKNLVDTFPKCQFIATTHSPQVIGEVDHDRIHIVDDNQVYSPDRSFGVDSSSVLEEIMNTDPRNEVVKKLLSEISRYIGNEQYNDARSRLPDLVDLLGENDPEVTRLYTLLDFLADSA